MRTITTFSTALLLLGCDLHRPLGNNLNVQPSSPLPGAGTGKANAPSSATPTLTWNGNPSADSYDVQVDSSCHAASSCAFTSPEINTTVTSTSFTPPAPLAFPTTGPQGQTYCWRVRGCQKGACGDWSAPRCFVVGADKSLNRDLNGDGYPDFVVGESYQPKAYVYLGGPNLPARPALVIGDNLPDRYGAGVAMVGDVNGDGYGDCTFATAPSRLDGEGERLMVFFGGPVLKAQPDITFTTPTSEDGIAMVTGCGDLNGDGYDDIAFETGHSDPTQAHVEIHFGGPDMATSTPLILSSPHPTEVVVFSIAAAGDMNGDGFPDLILGSSWAVPDSNGWYSSFVGEALIYYGGSPMDATADVIFPLPNPVSNVIYFPVAGVGDVNGDGFADVAIVAGYRSWESTVYVYYGGTAPHTSPDLTLLEEYPGTDFGLSILPAGDLNHDGYADFAVLSNDGGTFVVPAANGGTTTLRLPGKAFLYAGGQAPSDAPFATITAEASHPYIFGGSVLDADGDGEPEILVCDSDDPNGTPPQPQIAIYRSSNNYQTPVRVLSGLGESFGLGN